MLLYCVQKKKSVLMQYVVLDLELEPQSTTIKSKVSSARANMAFKCVIVGKNSHILENFLGIFKRIGNNPIFLMTRYTRQ